MGLRNSKTLKAACLAAGMATAWTCGEAQGDILVFDPIPVTITGEITPTLDLFNIHFRYGWNTSALDFFDPGLWFESLGSAPASLSTLYAIDEELDLDGQKYVLLATYDDGGADGVAISFHDPASIIGTKTWSELFEVPDDGLTDYSEETIAEFLQTVNNLGLVGFIREYYDIMGAPYAENSTIVNFSTATAGGIVTNQIPEPATFAIIAAPGLMLLSTRRRRRN